MNFRLRSYELTPPGGYQYPGFSTSPMIESLARQVQSYRQGNGFPRASYRESLQDVDAYQCQRLGNPTQFCIPSENEAIALADNAPGLAPCAGCGAPL